MSSKTIMNVLTTPSKIASKLDWRRAGGSVLSLDIHHDQIGLAVASHPLYGETSSTLRPIPLARKGRVSEQCRQTLSDIVKEHKVCGVVVSWPLQQDSGKMGAACGRVLYTLENILQDANIITPNRPFCLWEGNVNKTAYKNEPEDVFGRSAAYSRIPPSDKQFHKASQEQYIRHEGVVAAQVWDDFFRVHWPELHRQQYRQQFVSSRSTSTAAKKATKNNKKNFFPNENWEDTSSYVDLAVL